MTTYIIIAIVLFLVWYLNKKSTNNFFFQSEIEIRNKLKFIIDIWEDFGATKYDISSLRIAFEYFIKKPKEYNGSSIINDFWIIKGLEPESVIHDYDWIMARNLHDLAISNIEYCQRLRKRNAQWFWVWGFIFCGLTIVAVFKSIKFINFKK